MGGAASYAEEFPVELKKRRQAAGKL